MRLARMNGLPRITIRLIPDKEGSRKNGLLDSKTLFVPWGAVAINVALWRGELDFEEHMTIHDQIT